MNKLNKLPKIKEAELAEHIITYLCDTGWDVYQEVQIETYGRVADIVAVKDDEIIVVECKVRINLEVIEQANWWAGFATKAYVATPILKDDNAKLRNFIYAILQHFNLGWFVFNGFGNHVGEMVKVTKPNTKASSLLRKSLRPEHKTSAKAGTNAGNYFTPFSATKAAVQSFIKTYPGSTIDTIVKGITHHYTSNNSAKSCIAKWIRKGVIDGIKSTTSDKLTFYYPK